MNGNIPGWLILGVLLVLIGVGGYWYMNAHGILVIAK